MALDTLLDIDYLHHTVPWTHFFRAAIYYEMHKSNNSPQDRASFFNKMKGAMGSAVAMDCGIQNSLPFLVFEAKCRILENDFLAAEEVHQLRNSVHMHVKMPRGSGTRFLSHWSGKSQEAAKCKNYLP